MKTRARRIRKTRRVARPRRQATFQPLAIAGPAVQSRNDNSVLSGTDRVLSPVKISGVTPGQVLADLMVQPMMAKRMATLAQAYQQIMYLAVTFRVTAQAPSLVGGGYVAGFVRDPADLVPESDAVGFLIRNAGAKVMNWWSPSTYRLPRNPKWFYTEKPMIGADALREYSPARFLVVADSVASAANQDGYISIEMDWTVRFRNATYREEPTALPANQEIIMPGDAYVHASGSAVDLAVPKDGVWHDLKPTDFGLADGTHIRAPIPVTFSSDSGNYTTDVYVASTLTFAPAYYDPLTGLYVKITSPSCPYTLVCPSGQPCTVIDPNGSPIPLTSSYYYRGAAATAEETNPVASN